MSLPANITGTACAGVNSTITAHCCTVVNGRYTNSSGIDYCETNQFNSFNVCASSSLCKTNSGNTLKTKVIAALLAAALAIAPGFAQASPVANNGTFSPDAVGPPICSDRQQLVGDGDPHQNYHYQQVTQPIMCADGESCGTSELESHTSAGPHPQTAENSSRSAAALPNLGPRARPTRATQTVETCASGLSKPTLL